MAGDVILRAATSADVPAIAAVDAASWPPGLAAAADVWQARLLAFPDGQWLATIDGEIVGAAAAQRITAAWLNATPQTYERITDGGAFTRSHNPQGEIFQLIGVGVNPQGRGARLGRRLVDREIELARSTPGIVRIIGFTRPAGFHRYPDLTIDSYLALRDDAGHSVDPVVSFHLDAGARIASIHPDFRLADTAARGYGVLIEYPP